MTEIADKIITAAQKICDVVQDSGPPQIALPALAYACAELLSLVTPLASADRSARDVFVDQLDAHLKLMAERPDQPEAGQ